MLAQGEYVGVLTVTVYGLYALALCLIDECLRSPSSARAFQRFTTRRTYEAASFLWDPVGLHASAGGVCYRQQVTGEPRYIWGTLPRWTTPWYVWGNRQQPLPNLSQRSSHMELESKCAEMVQNMQPSYHTEPYNSRDCIYETHFFYVVRLT